MVLASKLFNVLDLEGPPQGRTADNEKDVANDEKKDEKAIEVIVGPWIKSNWRRS